MGDCKHFVIFPCHVAQEWRAPLAELLFGFWNLT